MKEIFCFPLSLLIKHGVDFEITNTAQKSLQTCNFHNKEKSSQDILNRYVSQTALHAVVFLDHNPAMGSFKAIGARIFV